jgi:hypothetical protein
MRKFLVVVVAISLLTTGCLVSPPSGTAAAGTKYDAAQDTRIVALEGIVLGPNGLQALVGSLSSRISGIADTSGLSSRISSVESRVSTVEGRTTTGGVTQATVDALSARIKTLEDWKASAGTSVPGTTTGGTTRGSVIASNGELELYLEKDMDSELYVDDNTAKTFFLSIKNKGTAGTYYRLNANFDLGGDISTIALIEPVTLSCENSSMLTFSRSTTVPGTVSGIAFTSQGSGGGSKVWIGKNTVVDLVIVLKINYTDPAVSGKLWNWDFSIREIN